MSKSAKKPIKKISSVNMRKKMFCIVGGMMALCFAVLICHLFLLQIIQGDKYKTLATNQQLSDISIGAKRGTIYDKNMSVLAQSATVWTVNLTPVDIVEAQREIIAQNLSDILGVDKQKVIDKTNNKTQYAEVKKKVEKPEAEKVRKFITENKIKGVYLTEDTKRFYPQNALASTVIGFTGTDNQGLAGLEAYYDKQLQGTPGRVVTAKNAWGTDMPTKYEKLFEAQNGNSLVTTIDQGVQMYLEKYLETAINEYQIKSKACGIIMNVKTGGILAMATKPDFDPNKPFTIADPKVAEAISLLTGDEKSKAISTAQNDQWRNKTVSDVYEPGSVFKIVTGSAGLEEQVAAADSHFNCPGFVMIGSQRYNCHQTAGHGSETFTDGMKNSCNPVFIEISKRLGSDLFSKYLKSFGISEKTGIDLPGEGASITHKTYSIYDLASNSFGQTIKITPLQMMSAACSAINGGYLYQPYVVSSIIDDNGNIIQSIEPNLKRQVVSNDTSAVVRTMLEKVVTEGGGKNAAVQGYQIGGKSGTSQKLDIEDKSARIASFFAFAPLNDPEIAILVICDDPQAGSRYGSMISAPIVSSVLTEVLPYLGLEPEYSAEELSKMNIAVPRVVDKEVQGAKNAVDGKGFKSKVVGSGSVVVKQVPDGSRAIPKGSTVILYTQEMDAPKIAVPSFKGLSYTQAQNLAANKSINIKATGSISSEKSLGTTQSVAEGTMVEMGTIVEVNFQEVILRD